MPLSHNRTAAVPALSLVLSALLLCSPALADANAPKASVSACPGDNGGITLPDGFCATVFADRIGHARHLAVAPNGVVYVNTWSGHYYGDDAPPPGGFLVALQDTTGNGTADKIVRFGKTAEEGSAGGTGIALYKDALYAEVNDRIVRYALPKDKIAPTAPPEVIVSNLPLDGDHPMHPFAIDASGGLYVDLGSATNACQVRNRMPKSPGHKPCTELTRRGGIWRYDANKSGQRFSPAERFATGIRNAVGIAVDGTGRGIYATQHGRDQLAQNWPKLYTPEQSANQPAEELLRIEPAGDYGWPECYYDAGQGKLVLAPEYGGDGGKAVGACAHKRGPVAAFPAHWAPNDLTFYDAAQFPAAYRGGAFIAFHGSWNRAPFPQGGYNVVFQPLADGKAAADYRVFADGFAGKVKEPGRAVHRPSGVAVGPDGALYISDDQGGRIWKVTYHGAKESGIAPARGSAESMHGQLSPSEPVRAAQPADAANPENGARAAALHAVPPGATAEEIALGDSIFHGKVAGAPCAGCHGSDAKGAALGPDLTDNKWLWGDGSLAAITKTIREGVAHPKSYASVMPPMGGAELTPPQLAAVAAFVWSRSHAR